MKAAPERNQELPFSIEFVEWEKEEINNDSFEVSFLESHIQADALLQTLMKLLPAATFMQFTKILIKELEEIKRRFSL